MREPIIENAKIDSVTIGNEDHGILTLSVGLSGSGWGVCVGNRCLNTGPGLANTIKALLKCFGVYKVNDLVGLNCRAVTSGCGGTVNVIGHIMEDKWVDFDKIEY